MFRCYLCKVNLANCAQIIKHLKLVHFLLDGPKLFLQCCVWQCHNTYTTYNGYRKHLLKHEQSNSKEQNIFFNNSTLDGHNVYPEAECAQDISDLNLFVECENKFLDNEKGLDSVTIFKIFILQLINISLTNPQMQTVIDSLSELIDNIFLNILTHENEQLFVRNFYDSIKQEILKYSTVYRRTKFLDALEYIKPKEIVIGHRSDNVFDRTSQTHIERNVPCNLQYIPILETLTLFISQHAHTVEQFLLNFDTREGTLVNGNYVKNVSLFNQKKYVLKLQLYYDDFETTNPLGSKTGSHKIGAVYFTIQNFPSALNTRLSNIHLLVLFFASDLKLNSNLQNISINTILKPAVNDIKILETEGLIIDGFDEPIFGTITSLSHDNLAGNILNGMVESFQANYYCRICLAHKNSIQEVYNENQVTLRTYEASEKHCLQAASSDNNHFGIKHRSILNDLQHFKLFKSMSVDIMHDILEGCVPLDIKLFVSRLTESRIISLELLNHRIKLYHYGYLNQNIKPSPISLDKPGSSVGQRAMQSWCLIRYLPLIIDDLNLTPELRRQWEVVLTLLDIMLIVFSPRIDAHMVQELETLVERHHKLFKREFGHNITPKLHFMVHYGNVIRQMGPLINLWCMRYEGKHALLKNLAVKFKNYKNLIKTLANKVQQLNLFHDNLTINLLKGPYKAYTLNNIPDYKKLIHDNIEEFSDNTEIFICNWVKFGYRYCKEFVICTGKVAKSGLPQFEKILDIIVVAEIVLLVTQKLNTIEYYNSLKAYKLQDVESDKNLVNIKTLIYREPYNTHQTHSGIHTYLVLKHKFIF